MFEPTDLVELEDLTPVALRRRARVTYGLAPAPWEDDARFLARVKQFQGSRKEVRGQTCDKLACGGRALVALVYAYWGREVMALAVSANLAAPSAVRALRRYFHDQRFLDAVETTWTLGGESAVGVLLMEKSDGLSRRRGRGPRALAFARSHFSTPQQLDRAAQLSRVAAVVSRVADEWKVGS